MSAILRLANVSRRFGGHLELNEGATRRERHGAA